MFCTIKAEEIGVIGPICSKSKKIRVIDDAGNVSFPDGVINWVFPFEKGRIYQINGNLFQTAASAAKHVIACGFDFNEAVEYIKSLPNLNKQHKESDYV